MKKPAEAARDPVGLTKVTTGTGELRIAWMIERMEVSRPPGVLIVIRIKARVLAGGLLDSVDEVLGEDRLDIAVNLKTHDGGWGRRSGGCGNGRRGTSGKDQRRRGDGTHNEKQSPQ